MAANRRIKKPTSATWLRQPSLWLVVIAGSLLVFFMIAIVREVIHGYNVRQQVARLQQQVTSEEKRQTELKDLLDYLASPTFQERQARLSLGLKRTGERVVIVSPGSGANDNAAIDSETVLAPSLSGPSAWWQYFFNHNYPAVSSN